MRSANRCRYCPTASRLASLADLMRYSGTAGWTRTTDLLIHSKLSAAAAQRHGSTPSDADLTIDLANWQFLQDPLTQDAKPRPRAPSGRVR
jgi:hypothetical protein